MRRISILILLSIFTVQMYGQEDNAKPTPLPPADNESNTETTKENPYFPKSETPSLTNIKKTEPKPVDFSREGSFSMLPEEFLDRGELYHKKVSKNLKSVTPETPEDRNQGSKTTQNFGDFRINGLVANILVRDHQYQDGDRVSITVNGEIKKADIYLENSFKGFKIKLADGFNKIDFTALNQGTSGPNTAEFHVYDEAGNLVSANVWNLATGVKATVVLIKE